MIKVKDGYAKLIGTTYQGSATQVLLSNGGDLEYSASSKASTLVQRNASQHIYATYFNSAISDEALTDIGSVYVRNTSDTFIRRVSKTQFYSILDDKFVTLDTTQSITGAKTFSTSVRFANNASIIQNQNDASNYTTILKWYKNGASRNTYDPSIGQHNTGGDGNGSICILPYPTATSPWNGTVGLFISKGVLKLDGKSIALAENYYTKTESDERYVNVTGDTMTGPLIVKAAITAAGGFYHNSVNSNSYVLLAGGSYKGLGDFAKGNAGSATKGVYVTGGTVTAMTYSLSSNLNSGTSGKLAYYSSATTVAAYSSSVGSSAQPIYLNAGSLSASSYSFTGTYSNPVIVWCGEIYRGTPGSTYWYSVKKGGCCSISFTTNNAGSNGNLIISIPHCEPYAAFCSTVRIFNGSTAISARDGTITGRSAGMGDYMTICGMSGTTGNVYIRKFSQQNADNDTWKNGELGTTITSNGNKPVARFYLMIVGRYI